MTARVAVLGRTRWLLDAASSIAERGHQIAIVWTSKPETFYGVDEESFRRLAADVGARFETGHIGSRSNLIETLTESDCELAVSVNWPSVLPADVLNVFPKGILNAHAGDLPRYRGNACPNWAILNGEEAIGLCIHLMAAELDAGPIVLRDTLSIGNNTYITDVYEWLDKQIPQMLADAVDGLVSGRLVPQPQPDDPSLSLRCYPRRPEDSKIDWSWQRQHLLRVIRASSRPFEGAFTTLEGQRKVVIWRAEPEDPPGSFCAVPGQICFRAGEDPIVAAGDGMIRLTEVDVAGVSAAEEAKRLLCSSLRARLV